jgi:hypothetical protein
MNELLIQIKKKQVKELESLSVGRNGNLLDHHPYKGYKQISDKPMHMPVQI